MQDIFHHRSPELFSATDANLTDAIAALAHDLNRTILTAAQRVCFSPSFLGCFDTALGLLAYINAGGVPALFRDSDGTRTLGSVTMPLGLFSHLTYEPAVQAFEPGARLLVVTKGVTDSERRRVLFGVDRVSQILQSATNCSAFGLAESVVQQAHQFQQPPWYSSRNLPFTKPEPTQDLTALVLQRPD